MEIITKTGKIRMLSPSELLALPAGKLVYSGDGTPRLMPDKDMCRLWRLLAQEVYMGYTGYGVVVPDPDMEDEEKYE